MKRWSIIIFATVFAVGVVFGAKSLINILNGSCVDADAEVYIPSGADYAVLTDSLKSSGAVSHFGRFEKVAKLKKLDQSVHAGKYQLRKGMSARALSNMFSGGLQTPVNLVINNIRTPKQLASKLSAQIEADSLTLLSFLDSDSVAAKYGFTTQELIGMFIPNTYEVWWTVSPEGVLDRMKKEYDTFWNEERKEKLQHTGLNQKQVTVLASIITEETTKSDEMPTMAGVYLNRLKIGMPLQADPTVKFAVGDFSLRRILHRHLEVDSPYNTYKYSGLPPAPICMPSIKAIDAVLNFKQSDYLYFCAKEDFSGYHNFARTLAEHNANARRYSAALNRAGIR